MEQIRKWLTISEMVDIETGEMITKSEFERYGYYKIRTTKRIEIKNGIGMRIFTWECEKTKQLKLL